MKPLYFLAVISLGIGFFSCKKESVNSTNNVIPEIHFFKEGLSYIQLKKDAYFIYKDSATLQEDSVIVSSSYLQTFLSPEHTESGPWGTTGYPAYYYDVFTLSMIEPQNSEPWFYGRTKTGDIRFLPDSASIEMIDIINNPFDYTQLDAFIFPVDSIIANMIVEGINYNSVIMTNGEVNFGVDEPNNIIETIYWAKNIGIIKREIVKDNNHQSFTLLRHG